MSSFAAFCCTLTSTLFMLPSVDLQRNTLCRFYKFPHYIETTTFGISCDAFANLKEILTRHKSMVAEYLDKNYDRVSWFQSHHDLYRMTHCLISHQVFLLLYHTYFVRKLRH